MKTSRASFIVALLSFTLLQSGAYASISLTPAANPRSGFNDVEVPMLFRGPMPAVEVMVNGKGPFIFAIDTGGAGMARVDTSLAERLSLKPTGKVMAGDGTGTNTRSFDTVTLDSITLGDIKFSNVTAMMRNYNQSPNVPQIDGILGFNLFADYLLTLDYPAKRVRIEHGTLPGADGSEILSFDSPSGIPEVDLKVGDVTVKAHIDSGNMGEITVPTSLVEKLPLAGEPVTIGKARTVTNEIEIKQAQLNGAVRFGRFEIRNPKINFAEIFRHANIGSRTLSQFSLTFDQKNRRVRLKRVEPKESSPTTTEENRSELQAYAGRYGQRTISFENGALYLQRDGGPKLKMIPASDGEFTLEGIPMARIKFVGSNQKMIELHVLNREGQWEVAKKDM